MTHTVAMATNTPFDNSSPPYFIYYSNASPFTDEYKKQSTVSNSSARLIF